MRTLTSFTDNERDVIRERHTGWEKASFALLAAVFDTHANTIRTICTAPRKPGDGRGNGNDCPTPAKPSIHQPLHHGSDSHGSVGSLGSIHGETNA